MRFGRRPSRSAGQRRNCADSAGGGHRPPRQLCDVQRIIRIALLPALLLLAGATFLYPQRFRRIFMFPNEPPPTELVVARWEYTAMGKFNGTGWSHNYPSSDQHFAQVVSEATGIDVKNASYRIVDLGSPEVFNYPFAVVSEPGEMALTEHEVDNLREYIDRGGFVVMDDFDGARDLATLQRDLHRAFPDRNLVRLTIDHEIFHTFFDIDALNVTSPYLVDG